MEITSKVCLEYKMFICFQLKNGKLEYELEYDEKYEEEDEEPYDKFNVYEILNKDKIKIHQTSITRNKSLKEGHYLFVFNKTKLFVNFINNKISYEIEELKIKHKTVDTNFNIKKYKIDETEIDLR